MNKRNLLVLSIAAALIIIVALLAFLLPGAHVPTQDAPSLTDSSSAPVSETAAPAAAQDAEPAASEAPADAAPSEQEADSSPASAEEAPPAELAKAYLLVTVQGQLYQPIPLYGEETYRVTQGDGVENVIHVTPDSVWMESSTCENQDCVLQGTVTLDNSSTRILGNMIVCLPNQVALELYSLEELTELVTQQ